MGLNLNENRLEEIKELMKETDESANRAYETGSCAYEDTVKDNLALMFSEEHIDWLIEQAEKLQKVEYEIDNSDMGTAVGNIISIVKG